MFHLVIAVAILATFTLPVTGEPVRFVVISRITPGSFSLCEIEAIDINGKNVAKGKFASQSATQMPKGEAFRAVDGSRLEISGCATTSGVSYHWWQLDLATSDHPDGFELDTVYIHAPSAMGFSLVGSMIELQSSSGMLLYIKPLGTNPHQRFNIKASESEVDIGLIQSRLDARHIVSALERRVQDHDQRVRKIQMALFAAAGLGIIAVVWHLWYRYSAEAKISKLRKRLKEEAGTKNSPKGK